jgi:hypothetical protein
LETVVTCRQLAVPGVAALACIFPCVAHGSIFDRDLASAAAFPPAPASAATVEALDRAPLAFVANRGQLDRRVAFSWRGPRSALFLTRREAVLALTREAPLRMRFTRGARAVRPRPVGRLPGVVNTYVGARERWAIGAPATARVRYAGVWDGIDVEFHGSRRALEYDFVVAPGADPAAVGFILSGAERMTLTRSGDLRLTMHGGRVVTQRAPVSYQRIGGRRVAVQSRYVLGRAGSVSIEVGAYDRSRALTIDPVFVLGISTFLGGASTENGEGIAAGADGAVYVTGYTSSTDFPTQAGQDTAYDGGGDAYVTKLSSTGALVWSTYLGGTGEDAGTDVAVRADGSSSLTGYTRSAAFPTTAGAYDTSLGGTQDAYLTMLSPAGAITYSTYIGGTGLDEGRAVAVGSDGATYATGDVASADFATTAGAFDTTFSGIVDAYAMKFTTAGAVSYATYVGGDGGAQRGYGIALGGDGSAYLTGWTSSSAFPITPGAFAPFLGGVRDAFVTRLNPTGGALVFSTYVGGSSQDEGRGVAVGPDGSAYVTGFAQSGDFPTTAAAFDPTRDGASDGFVTKLNAAGSALGYSTYVGGADVDASESIAVDSSGTATAIGFANSADFPVTADAFQSAQAGSDAFVTQLTTAGALSYSSYLGGAGFEEGKGVALGTDGSVYLAGYTTSNDYPTTPGAYDTTRASQDAFVTKLQETTPPAAPTGLSTTPASPSQDNAPKVVGTATAGTTVSVYANSACTGTPVATGSAADFADPGLGITVVDGSTATFHASATDVGGRISACSTDSVTYIESTPPADTPAPATGGAAAPPTPAEPAPPGSPGEPEPPGSPGESDPPDGEDTPVVLSLYGESVRHRCVRSARLLGSPKSGTGGLSFGYTLSAPATVRYRIRHRDHSQAWSFCPRAGGNVADSYTTVSDKRRQQRAGRHDTVVATTAGRRRLARTARAHAGRTRVRLARITGNALLPAGSYSLEISAVGADGQRTDIATVRFWVLTGGRR